MSVDEDKLTRLLVSQPSVLLAFMFGSQATGRAIPESDVDIAVWLKDETPETEVNLLWDDLEDLLKRPVDLVILNSAAPGLAWAAFRGKPLVVRDQRLYFSLMLQISHEAEDFHEFIEDFWRWREKIRVERGKTG